MVHFKREMILFFIIFSCYSCVKINNLHVPQVIKHRTNVVLDCDFTLEENDEDLVVKWFFNKNNQTLVYQWIPASNSGRPQVLGILKNRLLLNLDKQNHVSDMFSDQQIRHRSLHILEAGPDLSGNYTCSVSTLQNEDIRTKSMLVFVPENLLVIKRTNFENNANLMKIQCTAEGVFPRPMLTLNSQKRESVGSELIWKLRGNLYDISIFTILEELKVPEEFSCELKIPQANYTVRKETVIYPGDDGTKISYPRWIFIFTLLTVFEFSTRIFIHL